MSASNEPKVKVINMVLEGQLLPPAEGKCQKCAREHDPALPHDQMSLFWQYWFYRSVNGERWPTWEDAMAHCAPEIRERWKEAMAKVGVQP